mgnify:CR=1 FL=1
MNHEKMAVARKKDLEENPSINYPALKAIRAKCLDCSGGTAPEVEKCTVVTCPLWPMRFGERPHPKRGTYEVGRVMGTLSKAELSDTRTTIKALEGVV